MRISTNQIYANGLNSMLEQQAKLAKTQQQVATGKKLLSSADDPVGSVRSLELTRALERTGQYQRNANLLDGRLRLEESVLSDSISVLQRVRQLALQANNASQSVESRQSIASELRQQLDSLVSYANTRDSSGYAIFGGYQQDGEPFSYASGSVRYNGDDGQRQLQVGATASIADSDPGSDVFMNIKNGNGRFQVLADAGNQGSALVNAGSVADLGAFNGAPLNIEFTAPDQYQVLDAGGAVVASGSYQDGDAIVVAGMSVSLTGTPVAGDRFSLRAAQAQDLFSMVSQLSDAVGLGSAGPVDRNVQGNAINAALSNLDRAIDHLVNKQAGVGARMQSLERQLDTNAGAELQLQQNLTELTSQDYAEGITRMNQQLLSLQAAQQAFAKVQGLSLFNYL